MPFSEDRNFKKDVIQWESRNQFKSRFTGNGPLVLLAGYMQHDIHSAKNDKKLQTIYFTRFSTFST